MADLWPAEVLQHLGRLPVRQPRIVPKGGCGGQNVQPQLGMGHGGLQVLVLVPALDLPFAAPEVFAVGAVVAEVYAEDNSGTLQSHAAR